MLSSEGADFSQVLIQQKDFSNISLCGVDDIQAEGHDHSLHAHMTSSSSPLRIQGKSQKKRSSPLSSQDAQKESEPIDILMLYTKGAEDSVGGPEQMQAYIEKEVEDMNGALANSGLFHRRVRIAGSKKLGFGVESLGELSLLLSMALHPESEQYSSRFSGTRRALTKMHGWVKKYKADMVHGIAGRVSDACGLAILGLNAPPREEAEQICRQVRQQDERDFSSCVKRELQRKISPSRYTSVSTVDCGGGYTFAHEIGHNFSLEHGRDQQRGFAFAPGGFGYANPELFQFGVCQATIMGGYCDVTLEDYAGALMREPYFSNPDKYFPFPTVIGSSRFDPHSIVFNEKTPMGVYGDEYAEGLDGPANAVRSIDEKWDIVAGLSDFEPSRCTSERLNEIPSDVLSADMNGEVPMPASGGSHQLELSFLAPEDCSELLIETDVGFSSDGSGSAAAVTVRKTGDGRFELLIRVEPNNTSCYSRTIPVTANIRGSSSHQASMDIVQEGGHNPLCQSLSNAPADSIALDLSEQNTLSGFRFNVGGEFELGEGPFSRFTRLESLDLSGNGLSDVPLFNGLSHLEHLDLSHNEITTIGNLDFFPLSAIETIDLSHNRIVEVSATTFAHDHLGGLRRLYLANNRLGIPPDLSHPSMSGLRFLSLFGNELTVIKPEDFTGLSGLEYLSLSRNELTELPDHVFSEMPNLRRLWLRSNKIGRIAPAAFSGLSNLEYLNLSGNPLEGPLPEQVCDFLEQVSRVSMRGVDMAEVCPR